MPNDPTYSAELRKQKLAQLVEIEGFESATELCRGAVFDSVSPAICMNADCDYSTEMEPDQTRGWCEVCNTNTMQSALILAGLI